MAGFHEKRYRAHFAGNVSKHPSHRGTQRSFSTVGKDARAKRRAGRSSEWPRRRPRTGAETEARRVTHRRNGLRPQEDTRDLSPMAGGKAPAYSSAHSSAHSSV